MYLYVTIAKQGYNYQPLPQNSIFLGVFTTKESAIKQVENHKMDLHNHSKERGWSYYVFKTCPDELMNTHEDKAIYVIYDYIRK